MKIIRPPEMLEKTGIKSKSTIHEYVAKGVLTAPVQLSPQLSGWPEAEVNAIFRARAAGWPEHRIRDLVKQLMAARAGAAERAIADALQAAAQEGGAK